VNPALFRLIEDIRHTEGIVVMSMHYLMKWW